MDIFYSVKYIKRSSLLVVSLVFLSSLFSFNHAYAQSCNGFGGFPITGGITLDDSGTLCANQASPLPALITVTAGNLDDNNDPNNVGFLVLWGDGSNELVFPGDGRITHPTAHGYKLVASHSFPPSGPNAQCEYYPYVYPVIRIGGVLTTCATQLGNPPRILRWNTDDKATGELELSEQATSVNNYLVCEGTETIVTFQDRTTLNCNIPASELGGNPYNTLEKRWRRYDYGTTNTMTSVTGVKVAGVVETYPFRGAIITNTATAGNANAPLPGPTTTLPITVPADALVNQYFEITMRYWNYCNPYSNSGTNVPDNGDLVNGDNAPVSATARITIVTQPAAPTGSAALNYCNGTAVGLIDDFRITGAPAGSKVNWYVNTSAATPKAVGTKGALITTTTANGSGAANLPVTSYPGFSNTAAENYIVWVTYSIVSATNGTVNLTCESQPVTVTRSIREAMPANAAMSITSTSTFPICAGVTGVPLSVTPTVASQPKPIGGTWAYTWTVGSGTLGTGITLNATNGDNISFDIAATANGSKRITVTAAYTTNDSKGLNCSTTKDFNFTVNVKPVGGSITGGTTPICLNTSPGALTLSGQTGTVEEWQVDDGSGFTSIASTAGLTLYTPPAINTPGTYIYRVQIGSGVCAKAFSGTKTIVVRDRPSSAVLSGGATICASTSANLVITIGAGGQSPYTVVLSDGSSHGGYISGSNISVSPTVTTTYTITSVTDANGCTVATPTGSATINIGNPISATLSGAATICPSTSTNLTIAIVASSATVPPYSVVYKANGVTQPTISGYNSGDPITVSPLANTTYTLVSVTDASGCPATTLSGSPVVNVGAALVSATFSGGGAVCQNASKNLILTINGGVPPYSITVTPTSGPLIINTNYTSGGAIPVPTPAIGSIDYNITLITDNCGNSLPVASIAGNPQTVTVTPVPVGATNTLVPEICSGDNVNVDIFNTSVATAAGGNNVVSTYTWAATYPTGLTGGPSSGSGDIGSVIFALNNVTSGQLIADFRITPTATAGGCAGADFRIKVPVNPKPVASTPKTVAAICSGDNVSVNIFNTSIATAAGGNNVSSTYSWTATYPVNLTGGPASGTGNIGSVPFTLKNLTGGQLVAVFTVTPTSTPEGCLGSDFVIRVPVNPEPVGALTTNTSAVCSGSPINFNPQTVSVATAAGGNNVNSTFTWTAVNDAGLTGGTASGTGNITGTVINTSGGILNVTYTVTPRSTPNLCYGDPFIIVVPISSAADITTQPVNTPTCEIGTTSTGTVSFNVVASGPGIAYQWQEKIGAGAFANITDGTVGGVTYAGTADLSGVLTITGIPLTMNGYQYRVVLTTTGSCSINSAPAVLTVNPLPAAASPIIAECSDAPGANTRVVDLTSYNSQVNNGAGLTFTWWQDAAATASPITPGSLGGQDQSYTVIDGDVLYARVHNTTTLCDNISVVTFDINTTPVGNPILGPANVCVDPNPVLYQVTNNNTNMVTPVINTGSKYSWTIPAGFTVFGGGGGAVPGGGPGPFGNDPYVLLKFTTATTNTISVVERSADNCDGLPNDLVLNVASGPTVIPIAGGNVFCKNQKGVVFEVPQNPSSNYIWTVNSGATIVGASAGTGLYQVIVDFNNSASAEIKVTETTASGCPGIYPTLTVTLVDSPIMTGPFTGYSICSEDQPSSVLDLNTVVSLPSTFTWFVKTISPNITGAFQNQTGSGPLSHAPPLKNISGTDGSITYTVTPTAISAPGCIGLSADYTVVIRPEPVVDLITDKSVCPLTNINGTTVFDFKSNVTGATISWTNSNPSIGLAAASGTGNPSFIAADNLTGADIVSTITVTASANGCTSSGANSKTFTFTVKPRPVVDVVADVIICPGEAVSVPNFTANTSGETYAWTNDNTAVGLGASGPSNIPGFFATANNTGVDVVANISVKATLATCEGPARTFKIIIKPQPVVNPVSDIEFCPGEPISINLGSNVTSAIISWSNSNTGIGVLASGTGSPLTGTAAVNNTGAEIVGIITVSAAENGCTSAGANLKTFKITIKPTPIVDAVTDVVVCSGKTVPAIAFGSNVTAGGVIFNWTNDNSSINLPALGSGNISTFTAAVNTSGVPVVANLSVTGVKNLCSGPATTFRIIINPEPVVAAVGPQVYCPGDAINIPLSSVPATAAINWINSNPSIGLAATGTGDIIFTAPSNGTGSNITATIDVTATENGCTGTGANAKSFQIIIRPTPIVNNVTDVVVCSGGMIPAIVFSANTGGGELFSWTNDNTAVGRPATGSGTISSYIAPVNISGTPIVANFTVAASLNTCSGPIKTFKITINPEPVVNPLSDLSFCAGESINIPLGSNVPGAAITWSNTNTMIGLGIGGNGDIGYTAPVNNTGSNIVGTIKVIASLNGCTSTGTNTQSFDITIKPTPVVDPISNINVCSGDPISLIGFNSNVVSGGVTFNWTNDNTAINLAATGSGDIAAFTAAVNTTNAPFVANISVTGSKNLCTGPVRSFTITVNPKPVMASDLDASACSGQSIGLVLSTDASVNGVPALNYNIYSRVINPGLTTVSAANVPPSGVFGVSSIYLAADKFKNITSGSLPVKYKVRPVGTIVGCLGDEITVTIMIDPEPVIPTLDKSVCSSQPISLTLSTIAGGISASAYNVSRTISGGLTALSIAPAPASGVNATYFLTDKFKNTTTGSLTVTYDVDPVGSINSCIGARKTIIITIDPEPVGQDITEPVCGSGTSFTHDIQADHITNGITSLFTYTVTSSDPTNVPAEADRTAASNAVISHTYTNATGVPVTITYTITPFNSLHPTCAGAPFFYKRVISSSPVGGSDIKSAVCSDKPFTINPQDNVNAPLGNGVVSTFTWKVSYDGGASSTPMTGVITGNFHNESASVKHAIYTVTPNAGTCIGPDFTIDVPISPEPVMEPSLANPPAVCSTNALGTNNSINVTLTTNGVSVAADTYIISLKSKDLGLTGTPTVGTFAAAGGISNAIANDKFTNTSSVPLTVVYTVIPKTGSCEGDAFDITVRINPKPVLLDPGYAPVCSSNGANINPIGMLLGTDGNSVGAVSYSILSITYSSGGPFVSSLPGVTRTAVLGTGVSLVKDDRYNNTLAVPVTVKYSIQGRSSVASGACFSEPQDFIIVINPEPAIATINPVACSGLPVSPTLVLNAAAGSVPITSFELKDIIITNPALVTPNPAGTNAIKGQIYTSNDFLKDDVFFNVSDVSQPVTYKIVPLSGTCKGVEKTITLMISPAPALAPGLDVKVCSSDETGVILKDNSAGNSPISTAPFSAIAVSYDIKSITVDPGLTTILSAPLGVTTNADIIKLDKYENLTNDPHNVVYRIVPISAGGCKGPETSIIVTVEPKITITYPFTNLSLPFTPDLCSGTAINMTLVSPSNPTPNPNALPDPLITFNYLMVPQVGISGNTSANNVAQSFVVTDQLINNTPNAITVHYKITAVAASAAGGAGCSSVQLDVPITVEPKPKLIPTRLTQIACANTAIAGITLNSPTVPSAGYGTVVFELMSVVDPATNLVSTAITGNSAIGKLYNPGDLLNDALANSTTTSQVVRYTLRPHYSAGAGCVGDDVNIEITVNPRPDVFPEDPISGAAITTLEICSSESIEVSLRTTTDQASSIVKWTTPALTDVVGESGGVGDKLFATLLNKGNVAQIVDYTITPSFNGCDGPVKHVIVTVNPIPTLTVPNKLTICDGTPFVLKVTDTNSSGTSIISTSPTNTTLSWEVDDVNSIGTTPTEFNGNGVEINQSFVAYRSKIVDGSATLLYQITPIYNGGKQCAGIPKVVNVSVAPEITATITPLDAICEGTPVFMIFEFTKGQAPFDFVYSITDATGTVTKAITKSGNVKVEKITPTINTTYEIVSAKDALGCPINFSPKPSASITVYKKVTAAWTANIPPFIGGTSVVGFTNTSTPVDGTVFDYNWSFGTDSYVNPLSANGVGPFAVTYTRPGDHYVSLTASNKAAPVDLGCESSFSAKITIPVLPLVADFKFDPKAACFPTTIKITENTATGVAMDWVVRDGNNSIAATSNAPLPEFLITNPGKYTISLRTYDPFTHQEAFAPTAGKDFVIYDNPVASFDVRPTLVYVPDTELTTFNFSTGAPEYLWDFGDGSTSTEPEPKYTYKIEGIYDITLVAINDHGDGAVCTDTLSRKITAKQGGVTKVPNAFTPSPNGPSGGVAGNNTFNDVFLPIVKGAEEFNMQIFDRWGNLIFESNNSNIGWDGYDKNGKLMPAGVYVYKLTVRLSDGQRSTQLGDITMIR